MALVAVCSVHGVFESDLIDGGSSRWTLNNVQQPCPRCGRVARIIDGTFQFDGHGGMTVVSAPAWSIDALDAFAQKLRGVQEVLGDEDRYSAGQALRIMGERLTALERSADRQEALLASALHERVRGKPRSRALRILTGAVTTIGLLGSINPAIELTATFVNWAVSVAQEVLPDPSPGSTPHAPPPAPRRAHGSGGQGR